MASIAGTQRKAKRYAQETGDTLSGEIENLRDILDDLTGQATRLGGRNLAQARKTAYRAGHNVDAAVRSNPYAVAGAALALGVLAGVLLRR